ncbi:hypothetical protein BC829DRAFT_437695 [Chytridium lagenaria]|nr:hypothetical protein BC829DRAFT_437695 [Chytridium lagenaria]
MEREFGSVMVVVGVGAVKEGRNEVGAKAFWNGYKSAEEYLVVKCLEDSVVVGAVKVEGRNKCLEDWVVVGAVKEGRNKVGVWWGGVWRIGLLWELSRRDGMKWGKAFWNGYKSGEVFGGKGLEDSVVVGAVKEGQNKVGAKAFWNGYRVERCLEDSVVVGAVKEGRNEVGGWRVVGGGAVKEGRNEVGAKAFLEWV